MNVKVYLGSFFKSLLVLLLQFQQSAVLFNEFKKFILPFVPPVYCNWKAWKTCSNSWEFWVLSRWWNTRIQAPRIQNPGRFHRFNVVQTSRPWGQHFLALFKLPNPGANIYVQSLLKFPTWGAQRRSKCPPGLLVPPSGITLIAALVKNSAVCSLQMSYTMIVCTKGTHSRVSTSVLYLQTPVADYTQA